MILSHRWRFLFIKGHKIAGTSVEIALSTICGPSDVITPITPRDELTRFHSGGLCRNYAWDPADESRYREGITRFVKDGSTRLETLPQMPVNLRYFNHISLREALRRHQGDLSSYRIFCIERSPYSKALSAANMRATFANYVQGDAMRANLQQLSRALDLIIEDGTISLVRNIDLYRGWDGTSAADVLRYAELPGSLNDFLAEVGAPLPLLPHAKKGLLADTLDPRALLRPDQISKLNELFHEEFQTFGYPIIDP